jgi:hypothetical protein
METVGYCGRCGSPESRFIDEPQANLQKPEEPIMARRAKNAGPKPKKRKKVTVRLLKRMHAGEVTEPYRIMEKLLETEHGHLDGVKFAIAWRLGWRADADGRLELGKCRKRGDLDRELDAFDFVILLNDEAWPTLSAVEKRALVDHLLCHAKVVVDADGEPKQDDRGRLVCRIKKHEIEEFRAVIDRHGLYTADLSAIVQANINDSKRPLLQAMESGGGGKNVAGAEPVGEPAADKDAWCKLPIDTLKLPAGLLKKLGAADILTLGDFVDFQERHGDHWTADLKGVGPTAAEKISDAWEAFWAANPQYGDR